MKISLNIGPSTGWLYAIGINSLARQKDILVNAGANAVEISFNFFAEENERIDSLRGEEKIGSPCFVHKSIHIPDFDEKLSPEAQIDVVKDLVSRHGTGIAVLNFFKHNGHYPENYYKKMIAAGVPLAIENQDKNKSSGFLVKELEDTVRACQVRFVLDVQHAYERDHSMAYAEDLFCALKDKLSHLHVSGETENSSHFLVHKSRNAKQIVKFLGELLSRRKAPLILEGEYKSTEELKSEIDFLKKELS